SLFPATLRSERFKNACLKMRFRSAIMESNRCEGLIRYFVKHAAMSVIFSALSVYQSHNLQDLVTFLATVSTASWALVLLATLLRFGARFSYKRKSKQLQKEQA
ncbi:MAG: hypothetical protein ABWX94_01965, partial [Candidatus Saccharimonadales bacterium]